MGTPAHVVGERLMIGRAISRYFGQPRITTGWRSLAATASLGVWSIAATLIFPNTLFASASCGT
jgi:hypothetical protein